MKTGFTCLAGYNLAAAAEQDGRLLMGIVLGEMTAGRRDAKMVQAMRQAFKTPKWQSGLILENIPVLPEHGSAHPINRGFIAEECIHPRNPQNLYRVTDWSVAFGLETEKQLALNRASELIGRYEIAKGAKPLLIPQWAQHIIYRVAITGLTKQKATLLCLERRKANEHCIVLPPKTAQLTLARALATLDWIAREKNNQE